MMKLPNRQYATIDPQKITEYLLAFDHPIGRSKAIFFMAFGFTIAEWRILRDALLNHVLVHEITESVSIRGGTHYVIDGPLACPDGRFPIVRTVWRIDNGAEFPRFISAYPGENR